MLIRPTLALDRTSLRTLDTDGRMHIATTPISKANVCPYYGAEIPGADSLGLVPDRIYRLYRDPDELAKAASTFNNIPLLEQHVPVSADDPRQDIVVGTTGSDAAFEAPYLRNSLAVWTAGAVAAIEDSTREELSCSYYYRADMTPGVSPAGEAYDGVMRDIVGNHVALVDKGRAGPDVRAADAAPKKFPPLPIVIEGAVDMATNAKRLSPSAQVIRGALTPYLRAKLAADAQVDLRPILMGTTAVNFAAAKPTIITKLVKATKGKLAKDADLSDLAVALDAMDEFMDPAEDEDDKEDEDEKKAADEDKEDDEEKAAADRAAVKVATDAAIAKAAEDATTAAVARMNGVRAAERDVAPWVGQLAIDAACGEDVYKAALDVLKVATDGAHPSAYRHILMAQAKPSDAPAPRRLAADAGHAKGFAERFPQAGRLLNA